MKLFSLSILTLFIFLCSACNNDLEDRLDSLEKSLITDPLHVSFSTKDNNNKDESLKTQFKFKPTGWGNLLIDNKNDTYTIIVERYSDVEASESSYTSFTYNPKTKALTQLTSSL